MSIEILSLFFFALLNLRMQLQILKLKKIETHIQVNFGSKYFFIVLLSTHGGHEELCNQNVEP